MAVAFLMTHVKSPVEDDWGKLKCMIKYPEGTRGATLTLRADNLYVLKWWVDVSFAVHSHYRGA